MSMTLLLRNKRQVYSSNTTQSAFGLRRFVGARTILRVGCTDFSTRELKMK